MSTHQAQVPEQGEARGWLFMPQLGALRAFAVLAILLGYVLPWLAKNIPLGHAGFRLVFVLSGYLATALLLRYRERASGGGKWAALGEFYVRGCLRVWPVYYLVVALGLAFDVGQAREIMPWLLTHTVNFCIAVRGEWVEGFFHFWAIAVVEQFVFVWALVVLFAPRRLLLPITLALIAVGPLYRGWAVSREWGDIWTYCTTPGCFDTLGAGALLALLLHDPSSAKGVDRGLRLFALPGGLAALALLSVLYRRGLHWPNEVLLDVALALVFSWLVRGAARGFRGMAGWVFEARPILYLGAISYGIYVYHAFLPEFLPALERSLASGLGLATSQFGWLQRTAYVACLIGVPVLSWHFLEKPIRGLREGEGFQAVSGPSAPGVSRTRGYITLAACSALVLALIGGEVISSLRGRADQDYYDRRARDDGDASAGTTYYVSPSGSDDNPGTQPDAPWRSLERVNRSLLGPGDSVCLQGGQTFAGSLIIDRGGGGSPRRPVSVGSYGSGRATILAGDGPGVDVRDAMGVCVHDLIVIGSGIDTNRRSGIVFENDLTRDIKLSFVRIERVEVSGFGEYGILVMGNRGRSGFRDVRISDAVAHDNALAGIYVRGKSPQYSTGHAHEDVTVEYCRAHNNPGLPGPLRENSGSGIVLSDVDGGVIQHCVAWENGRSCSATAGGPVGIWAWDSNEVVIQCNESYGNLTGGPKDGGGFDLDGGVTNSVLQYNYSHDNDGAGYLLCQFVGARRFGGNTVRYNISQNDGRRNLYGGIHLHDDGFAGRVRDCQVYNNTVYTSPCPDAGPSAFIAQRSASSDISVRNNIFQCADGADLVSVFAGQHNLTFQGNDYFSGGGEFRLRWEGVTYPTVAAWRAATGQERVGGREVGTSTDPGLRAPGRGTTFGNASLLPTLDAYRLGDDSRLVGAGLDLAGLFGIEPGATDFFGTALPRQGVFDVGAHHVDRSGAARRKPDGREPHE
jgi:peptidoglycan/LPS O-acetylase OafA/YrhL